MGMGAVLSGLMHAALIALALFGLPWFAPRERDAIRVTEVSFVSEAEFAAAREAAAARAETEAPAPDPAPVTPPPPRETPPEAVTEVAPQPEAPEEEAVASLAPAFNPDAPLNAPGLEAPLLPAGPDALARPPTPETALDAPEVSAPGTLASAAPPLARQAPRIAETPTPPAPETARPAEAVTPAPAPEPLSAETLRPPEAPQEAAPEPQAAPAPPQTAALATSARPLARPRNLPAPQPAPAAPEAPRQQTASATPPTEPTPPSVTPPAPATPPSNAPAGPVGPPLSVAEKDGLKFAIKACWSVPAGVREAEDLRITVGVELDPGGGIVDGTIRLLDPAVPPDTRYEAAFRAARIALLRCAPYSDMPRDKYAQWRTLEVVFNPEGMVSW